MEWVEANGAVFRTERVGGGSGHPLLLIHELGGDMTSWDPALAAGLCDKRPALRFDWRGSGMSEKIRGPFTIDDMCADIAGVLDATGFGDGKPVDIIGIALGGGVERHLLFEAGRPVAANGPGALGHEFAGDTHIVRVGPERYEIPDAVVNGGEKKYSDGPS
jgi:3-oxoadipate enol-lactonase